MAEERTINLNLPQGWHEVTATQFMVMQKVYEKFPDMECAVQEIDRDIEICSVLTREPAETFNLLTPEQFRLVKSKMEFAFVGELPTKLQQVITVKGEKYRLRIMLNTLTAGQRVALESKKREKTLTRMAAIFYEPCNVKMNSQTINDREELFEDAVTVDQAYPVLHHWYMLNEGIKKNGDIIGGIMKIENELKEVNERRVK